MRYDRLFNAATENYRGIGIGILMCLINEDVLAFVAQFLFIVPFFQTEIFRVFIRCIKVSVYSRDFFLSAARSIVTNKTDNPTVHWQFILPQRVDFMPENSSLLVTKSVFYSLKDTAVVDHLLPICEINQFRVILFFHNTLENCLAVKVRCLPLFSPFFVRSDSGSGLYERTLIL